MEQYQRLKNELSSLGSALLAMLDALQEMPEFNEPQFDEWHRICSKIETQLNEDVVRIAVVGPIKSGKSTFVNSLLKGDFLKRGAGVVTSFVTRVRKGEHLKAKLRFKSWDDINREIARAAQLLPTTDSSPSLADFDIRRKKDRHVLAEALHALSSDQKLSQNTKSPASVLLSSCLKGFDTIKTIGFNEDMSVEYAEERFESHRDFSGDEILAVYLKDIQLEVNTDIGFKDLELADCQGSDSPNPLHLALIQDYLLTAHLLIYVISSRTGLRQADIRFLSMIKKMGIMGHILFVVNCDFSEHETVDGLKTLIDKISDEVTLIKPNARIFTFSALYNLFQTTPDALPEKDRKRLEHWRAETAFTQFSDQETERFSTFFTEKVTNERFSLLLRNHFERMRLAVSGLRNWVLMRRDVLTGDTDRASTIIKKLHQQQLKIDQLTQMIKKTIDGQAHQIKNKLRKDIDGFLDNRYGEVGGDLNRFIRSYAVTFDTYADALEESGFNPTLFMVFQDFKNAVDTYMTQTVAPRVIGYLHEQENSIRKALETVALPFGTMIKDTLNAYEATVGEYDIPLELQSHYQITVPEMESVKRVAGLNIPQATAMLQYSTTIRTDAFIRLGFYSLRHYIRKMFKRQTLNRKEEQFNALSDSVRRMKHETEKHLAFHFKNYRENIKFQYLFKLVDAAGAMLYQNLVEQFRAHFTDLSTLGELMNEKRIDKERIFKVLDSAEKETAELDRRIRALEQEVVRGSRQ